MKKRGIILLISSILLISLPVLILAAVQPASSTQSVHNTGVVNDEIQISALFGWLITIICSILGWSLAIFNTNIQYKRKLRAETADELIRRLHEWTEECSNLESEFRGFLMCFQINKVHQTYTMNQIVDQYRKTNERGSAMVACGARCELYFESKQIILFKLMKIMVRVKEDFSRSIQVWRQFVHKALDFVGFAEFPLLSEEQLHQLDGLINTLMDEVSILQCHISDFIVELQNEFFSRMFHHSVPRRKPIDPKYEVLTIDG